MSGPAPTSGAAPGVPVITIDGPTASGKGTIAGGVARVLGWHVLDSGALYRLTALAVRDGGVDPLDEAAVAAVAANLDVAFPEGGILLGGREVSGLIRKEEIGALASRIAVYPLVREALLNRQRAFQQAPGLVADGRDMGTLVFPDAPLKIFLVADVRFRAERRCKQLKAKGFSVNLSDLLKDMEERDSRDRERAIAPLFPAPDAVTVDSSDLSIDQTVDAVLQLWAKVQSPGRP